MSERASERARACVRACVCVCVRSFLPPHTCRSQNIGTNGFTSTLKKTLIVVFGKNASFRSYGVISFMRILNT